MHLRNVANCVLYVDNGDGNIAINPSETLDVDGRKAWDEHLFVKAGWLEVIEDKKPDNKKAEK